MTSLLLKSYQVGLQVILEKKAGNIHVNNLHAILLMEGVFNTAIKIFIGAWIITNAMQLKLIPDESYGSCPGCMAILVSLNCKCHSIILGNTGGGFGGLSNLL